MNPAAIPVSLLTIGNTIVGQTAVAESGHGGMDFQTLLLEGGVIFSNVALVVVTWLLIHITVKESRKHEREAAELDDKQQARLTSVIDDALERAQNAADHEPDKD